MSLDRKRNICYILCAMLVLAIFAMPHGYYTFLRICIFLGAGYFAYKMFGDDIKGKIPYTLGAITILFNPIIPIYLDRQLWTIIDLACAVLFFVLGRNTLKHDSSFK